MMKLPATAEAVSGSNFRAAVSMTALIAAAVFILAPGGFGTATDKESSSPGKGGASIRTRRFTIVWHYYGSGAEEIERLLTVPLENALAELSGIRELVASSDGSCSRMEITAEAGDSFPDELREIVERAYNSVYTENRAVQKPVIFRRSRDRSPCFVVSFRSEKLSRGELRTLVEQKIKSGYSRLPGVGETTVTGGGIREIHLEVEPALIASADTGCTDFADIISGADLRLPAGRAVDQYSDIPLSAGKRLDRIESILEFETAGGGRLGTGADIRWADREEDEISRYQGEQGICIQIRSPLQNLRRLSGLLKKETDRWRAAGLEADIIYDGGAEEIASLRRTAAALAAGIILSSAVLAASGAGLRRTLIITAGQPIILLLSLAAVKLSGFEADSFILAGFAVGSGISLDSAVIMTSSTGGFGRLKKTVPAVCSSAGSTVLAMLPLLRLRSDIDGIFQLIIALSVMIIISLLLSVIFIPVFYGKYSSSGRRWISEAKQKLLSAPGGLRAKRPIIGLRHSAVILLTAAGTAAVLTNPPSAGSITESPVIFASFEAAEGLSLEASDRLIKRLTSGLLDIGGVESVQSTSRRGGGDLIIDCGQRPRRLRKILKEIAAEGERINEGYLYLPGGRGGRGERMEIRITGPDTGLLKEKSKEAAQRLLSLPFCSDPVLHFRDDPPAYSYIPDRDAVSSAGLNPRILAEHIRWYLQGPVAHKWLGAEGETDLRIMALGRLAYSIDDLRRLKVPAEGTDNLSLSDLGTFVRTTETTRIERLNREHSASFSLFCEKANPLRIYESIWKELDGIELPPLYSFVPSAEMIENRRLLQKTTGLFILTLTAVFILLCIERESFSHAALIIFQLPFILLPPLTLLFIPGFSAGTEIIIGLIILSGMGINNGILILSDIGEGPETAVERRFSDLLLTSLTSMAGLTPLLFTGSEFFTGLTLILTTGLAASFFTAIWIFPKFLKFYTGRLKPASAD